MTINANLEQASKNGILELYVWEKGIFVEQIQVCFYDKDEDKKLLRSTGKTPINEILQVVTLKPGTILDLNRFQKEDLNRIVEDLGFSDATANASTPDTYKGCSSSSPGKDPYKATVVIQVPDEGAARRARNIGSRLSEKKTPESLKQAVVKYQEALRLAEADGDLYGQAADYHNLGNTYSALKQDQQAADTYSRAAALFQILKFPYFKAVANSGLGDAYYKLNEYEKALEAHVRALKLVRDIQKNPDQLSSFGKKDFETKESIASTLAYFEAVSLFNMGESFNKLGDYQQSLYALNQALPLWQANKGVLKNKQNDYGAFADFLEAFTLFFIGLVYTNLDNELQAQIYRQKAKEKSSNSKLIKELNQKKDSQQVASYLENYAAFFSSNPNEWYEELVKKILAEAKRAKDFTAVARTLVSLGQALAESEPDRALNYYDQALPLLRQTKNDSLLAFTLSWSADLLSKQGRERDALARYKEARSVWQIAKEPVAEGIQLNAIGRAYFRLGDLPQAQQTFEQALQLGQRLKEPSIQAAALLNLAKISRQTQQLDQAQSQMEKSIQQLEAQTTSLATPGPVLNFSSALNVTESSPVGVTSTQERTIPLPDPNPSSFKSFKDLTSYFAKNRDYYEFYIDLLMQLYQERGIESYKIEALKVSERFHARSLLSFLSQSKQAKTVGQALLAEPPNLTEIQQMLDDDTVLLEYSLGKEQSYLWLISKDQIDSYPLKPRKELEADAQAFYRFLTEPSLRVRPNKTAQAGLKLSQELLGPVYRELGDRIANKRLVIVADGFLHYIPFNALPVPNPNLSSNDPNLASKTRLLLNQHQEIVNLPSASTLAVIRKNSQTLPDPTKSLAIMTNPVFAKKRSTYGVEQIYPNLPDMSQQATQILGIVPERDRSQSQVWQGYEANLQNSLSADLVPFKILHFATHGILDSQRPERSGMVLSVVNVKDELQRSLLSPTDIFNMQHKLSADLVVLSGCRTGLGASVGVDPKQEIKGEGLVGLTGSFMYAGAERVIASLWSVDDAATTELMQLFYRNVFEKKMPYAAALRQAQRQMQANPRWREPYYWAGFIIQGEWR